MFVRGQRDGRGTFVMQGKEMFFGEFVEGYEHGRGVYTLPDFSFFDGVWVDGVRHGVGVSFPPPEKDAKVRAAIETVANRNSN
jgi:1-phosphatidylinositol-4-phosphate 5-kinase